MDTADYPNVATALAATFERAGEDWWVWELKARAELDYEKREAIYRQGIQQFPNSWELYANFAILMGFGRQKLDEAEQLFRKALELNPENADSTGNFANFMAFIRHNPDEAERLYRTALELDPHNAIKAGNFGQFLVTCDRVDEGVPLLQLAWILNGGKPNQLAAPVKFEAE